MKFNGSVIGKIFLVLICLILGIVIGLGGLVGGVYLLLTKYKVGDTYDKYIETRLDDKMKNNIELSEEARNLTILQWGQKIAQKLTSMDTTTIGDLEGFLGYKFISNALNEVVGIDGEKVKDSTLGNLGETIMNNLTVSTAQDKFGVSFPDLPLFKNSEFLNTTIANAFSDLADRPLSDFIETGDDTHAVINAIKDLTINELGSDKLNGKINSLKLSEVLTDISEDNKILTALKDKTIGELSGDGSDEIVNSLFFDEIMNIDDGSKPLMKGLKYSTLESITLDVDKITGLEEDRAFRMSEEYLEAKLLEVSGYEYIYDSEGTAYVYVIENGVKKDGSSSDDFLCYKTKEYDGKNRPFIGVDSTVYDLPIRSIVDISPDDKLMNALADSTLNTIADDINTLFLDQIMTIDASSSKTIVALRYSSLTTVTELVASEEFADYSDASKELKGYVYRYVADGDGYVPYVMLTGSDGEATIKEGKYELVKAREYAGFYRPMISVDEKVSELFIGELIENPDSQTLKSLSNSSLENKLAYIRPERLRDGVADEIEYQADGFTYKYSYFYDIPYVVVYDENGEVKTDPSGAIELYQTRFYDGKYMPLRGLDDKVKTITFGEVVEIDETDPNTAPLMKNLKNTRVEDMDATVNRLFLAEMLEIEDSSATVLKSIKYTALQNAKAFVSVSEAADNESSVTPEMRAKHLPGFTYKYAVIKGKLTPFVCVVDGSGNPVTATVNDVNSYETYETKEFDGFFRPIRSLNEKLDDLALNEVFTAEQLSSGVLSLLEPETKVNDIGDKVADKIQKSSLAKLGGVGVIDTSEGKYDMDNTPRAQRAFIWNNNLGGMLESLIKFVDSPVNAAGRINYDVISEPTVNLTKNSYTLSEFIAAYEQYQTLVLNDNVTITVTPEDAVYQAKNGKYYIPVFNLEGDAYTFNVTGGEVVLAAMEKTPSGAITLADHQFFYAYDATNGGNGSGLKYYDGTETDKSGTKVTMGVPGVATESFVEYKKIG